MYGGIDSAVIMEEVISKPFVRIAYPRVRGINEKTADLINELIEEKIKTMTIIGEWQESDIQELDISYQVTLNQKGLLSLRFESFLMIRNAAHPTTSVCSLTVDLNTGKVYELYDFFRNMSGHAIRMTNYILGEMKEKGIPLIFDLKLIPDNHVYYLTEDALVIYFQEAELAPRVYGILEFPLSYAFLQNIMESDSPLRRLL